MLYKLKRNRYFQPGLCFPFESVCQRDHFGTNEKVLIGNTDTSLKSQQPK